MLYWISCSSQCPAPYAAFYNRSFDCPSSSLGMDAPLDDLTQPTLPVLFGINHSLTSLHRNGIGCRKEDTEARPFLARC